MGYTSTVDGLPTSTPKLAAPGELASYDASAGTIVSYC